MDIFTALHTRRSVRKFTGQPVGPEEIRTLLEAGMIAPSAGNAQPWQFIILTDRSLLEKASTLHPYVGMAAKAPLGIIVCGDTKAEKYPGFWVQDCSAAVENILLAATGLGLGSVWTGIHPLPERVAAFQELCSLPDYIVPLALLVIGHSEVASERKSRYDEAKVHQNRWNG